MHARVSPDHREEYRLIEALRIKGGLRITLLTNTHRHGPWARSASLRFENRVSGYACVNAGIEGAFQRNYLAAASPCSVLPCLSNCRLRMELNLSTGLQSSSQRSHP